MSEDVTISRSPTQNWRDAERRRREIIEAAIQEFSNFGFGGARVDRIAQRANTNKAMLYHYFDSKEDLYRASLHEIYSGIRAAEDQVEFEMSNPPAAIRTLVAFTLRYYIEHPTFVRIINTENLHGAIHLKAAGNISALNAPILDKVAAILSRGAAMGVFRADVDPLDFYISISALSFTYVANHHTLEAIFGRDLLAPAAVKARLSTMTDMVLRFLLPLSEKDTALVVP